MSAVDDDDKIRVLWKQSRGVVDIHKGNLYTDTSERPFVRQTLNKEVFSDEVPESLGSIPPTWNAPNYNNSLPDYSVENLDASFNSLFLNGNNAYAPGTVHNLAVIGYPQLDYYHRHQFVPFSTADLLPNGNSTTWYIPDPLDQDLSLARNTIPFNKGGRGDYQYKFRITATSGAYDFSVQELEDPYKFIFDNQSGFILMYGDDDSSSPPVNWALDATSAPLYGSFIKYVGAKGAGAGTGSGGSLQGWLDASFNNVDISNNLNMVHGDLETGILQSKRISYTVPHSTGGSTNPQSVIIAKVEDDPTKLLNATGYFTLELKDGTSSIEASEAHTKIHFLAGITTKEATNPIASAPPAPPSPGTSSSSAPTTLSTNTIDSQISVPQQIQTLNIEPTTINLQPIVQPIIEPTLPVEPTDPDPVAIRYMVTVQEVNGDNKFLIDGVVAPQLNLVIGNTYIFDQTDPSNLLHQLEITELPQPGTPVIYSSTTGSPGDKDSEVTVTIPQNANKVLYYVCRPHGIDMGNQINVLQEEPITIQPIIDPTPPGVSPIIDSNDEENTIQVTTLSSNTVTNIEFTGFIKVISCIRQFHAPGIPNIGIESLELAHELNSNLCYLILHLKVDPIVTILNFNVRLYKNSLNIMNTINHLQWTLTNIQVPPLALNQNQVIKKLYIGAGPDSPTIGPPVYPNHPTEPFTATTQFSVVDNSMNVYGNLNIKGDVNVDTNIRLSGNILGELSDLYTHRVFTNSDFLSRNIPNGSWETIAYVPLTNIYYNELNLRSGYAHFEVVDRSNPDSLYTFKDTLSFIVNFVPSSNDHASCSLTLLSSTAARNEIALTANGDPAASGWNGSVTTSSSGNYGYIEKVAVELGEVRIPLSSVNSNLVTRTGAIVKIFRKSDATNSVSFTSTTDVRVIMYNNMKTVNETLSGIQAFVLGNTPTSYWHTVNSNYLVEFNLLKESSGHKTVLKGYQDGIIRGYTSSAFSKVSGVEIIGEDISGNLIRGDIVRATNGEMDELDVGTGADEIKVNRKYGGTASNPNHNTNPQVSSGGSGRESKINSRPDHHGQLTNRAYVQEEVIRVVPSGVSPGIVVANNDWITIAKLGPFDAFAAKQIVSKNSFRGTALFELQDRSGSHHHNVKFVATFEFNKACLKVIHNSFYSANRFNEIRIKYGGTYQGAVLQFSIDTAHSFSAQNLYLKIWQNTNDTGWVCTQDFIQVENTPNIYVPNFISGGYNSNTGIWANGSGFGTAYPNTESVSVSNNHTNDTNFYERFKNGILVQGGTSNIAMGGGDLELEGGNIIMNSSSSGTGNIEMAQGDIENANDIHGNHFHRSDSTTISIGAANLTNKHFTWFREPTRLYSNTDSITTQYLDDIGFEGACMYNNDDKLELVQINRKLHNGKANFDTVDTIIPNAGDYSGDIKDTEVEVKPFAVTSPFKETILVSLSARNTARVLYRRLMRGTANNFGNGGAVGMDVTAGHLQYQAGYPGFDITSTTQNGQPYVAGLCFAPYDLYIKKIVSRHFSYKCEINNNTGASRTVYFEVYLAYGPNASNGQHPFQFEYISATNQGLPDGIFPQSYTCPQNCGVRRGTVPVSVATAPGYTGTDYSTNHGSFRLARYSRIIATGTTTSDAVRTAVFHTNYNNSVESNFKNPTVYNIVDLYGRPIKIPAGSNYGIYLLERRGDWTGGTFNNLEFTGYTSRNGGFASVPITYEIYGEMDMYEDPS